MEMSQVSNFFANMQWIVPTIKMDQRKELKMSMNSYERAIYAEYNCDSENSYNCAVNNTNCMLNAITNFWS